MKKKQYPRSIPYQVLLDEHLEDPERAIGFLNACLEENDMPEVFLSALRDVVRIHGVALVAEKTNLNRENLYRMLSKKGNPRISSLIAVLDALGFRLSISPKSAT